MQESKVGGYRMKMIIEDFKATVEYGKSKDIKTRANAHLKLMEMERKVLQENQDVLRSLILKQEKDGKLEVSIPICRLIDDEEEC